jgi:beta-glucosidase
VNTPRRIAAFSSRLFKNVAAVILVPAIVFLAAVPLQAQTPYALTPEDKQQIESIIQRMTVDQKLAYIGGTGFAVRAVPEVSLPAFEMSDGPVGVRSNSGFPSTTYAGGIGLAATWDRSLAAKVGAGIGRDARARGVYFMLGPGVNIYRSPKNGRNFEYFGEDPFLSGQIAVGYITGMQSEGVSATVKHFLANNAEYLRHDSDSIVDERTLREIYLPAFEAAVRQGHVGAVMDSYNLINGKHATENGYFNTEILRKEWGFPGTLMSDWVATYDAVGAANGGLDIEMPNGAHMNQAKLAPAIASGQVTQATIDDKVRHILTTAFMFDWTKRDQREPAISVYNTESNGTALQSAREAPVLLKNESNLLPLDKSTIKTVLLVGPNAYPGTPVGGGSAGVVPFHGVSLLEGMSSVAPAVNVLYDPGLPTLTELANQTNFTTAESGGKSGLIHESFKSKDLSGPANESTVSHINFAGIGWDAISGNILDIIQAMENGDSMSVSHRYTGFFNAPTAGAYLVALTGGGESNGDRVTIDGKVVIDDWTIVRAFEPHLPMPLSAGLHKVVVESWQSGPVGGQLRFAIAPLAGIVSGRAKLLAAKADVVIVAAGFSSGKDGTSESEGGDRTFDLPFGQDALIEAMAAANPKTIVAVTSGGNVDSKDWIDKVPGYIEAWYGGQAGGQALAEILFGDVNPSGHLPATFERRAEDNPTYNNYYPDPGTVRVVYKEGIFVGYRGYEKAGTKPLFPFGFGLSYTNFTFANLKLTAASGSALATVEFDVTNTGQRKGAEVAQVYVSDTHAKLPRPMHELKGFERVELAPGETRHFSLNLDGRAFAYYDVAEKKWTIDPGKFKISVGDSLASLPLSGNIDLTGESIRSATF